MPVERFFRIVIETRQTFFRYPISLLLAFAGVLLGIYDLETASISNQVFSLLLTVSLGIVFFMALESFLLHSEIEKRHKIYIKLFGLSLLVFYFFSLPRYLNIKQYTQFALWLSSFALAFTFVPYISRREIKSFWFYNEQIFIRILLTVFYSSVLFIGLMIAILSLDHLFNFHLSDKIYWETLLFVFGCFGFWFFLAGIPLDLVKLYNEEPYPQRLKLFTLFVLLPMLSLYGIILYIYLGKIIITWNLPQGWVSYLVAFYSAVGLLSMLFAFPFSRQSNRIRVFSQRFYWSLLPLIILMLVAVGRRVRDYGLTENRYLVILFALWLLGIAFYFLYSKKSNLKVISMSLSVLIFLAAWGPWGAFSMSEWSQVNRMSYYLTKSKLLEKGKIRPDKARKAVINEEDAIQIGAIINYLGQRDELTKLQKFFYIKLDSAMSSTPDILSKEERLLNLIGNRELFWSTNLPIYSQDIYFTSNKIEKLQKIKEYDYSIAFENYTSQEKPESYKLENYEIRLKHYQRQNILRVYNQETDEILIEFDLNLTFHNLMNNFSKATHQVPPAYLTLRQESQNYQAQLKIHNLNIIRLGKNEYYSRGLSATLFLRLK
jgi:hypothetical protein